VKKQKLEVVPGTPSRLGSAYPSSTLAPPLNLVSDALESFQGGFNFLSGGLSPPLPPPIKTDRRVLIDKKIDKNISDN